MQNVPGYGGGNPAPSRIPRDSVMPSVKRDKGGASFPQSRVVVASLDSHISYSLNPLKGLI